jgi:DNA-binding NtrC family response regulator
LPGGDVLRAFREIDATIPIVVITGSDNTVAAEAAAKHGACGYVLKPSDLGRLDALIGAALPGANRASR